MSTYNKLICCVLVMILLASTACTAPIIESASSGLDTNIVGAEKRVVASNLVNPRTIIDEPYFKMLEGDGFEYYYYIYDNNKEVVEENGFARKPPSLSLLDDSVVNIRMGMGTGIAWDRYYSLERDAFSKTFYYVRAYSDELIAYVHVFDTHNTFETSRLVIRNAFDKSQYYKEVKLDFSRADAPVKEARFINDNTQLEITYVAGEGFREITEIIDLNEP